MPIARSHRNADGALVPNVFDRVATSGDVGRFSAAENGYRYIVHIDNAEQDANGVPLVTAESGSHLFQLPFSYIVSANQLQVLVPDPERYASTGDLLFLAVPSLADKDVATIGWTGPADTAFGTYYEEVASSTVRVYGLPDPTGVVLFLVPHTALPAANREKVIVLDQGDNAAVEFRGSGDGVLFTSPSGGRFLLRVDDSGTLVVEPR